MLALVATGAVGPPSELELLQTTDPASVSEKHCRCCWRRRQIHLDPSRPHHLHQIHRSPDRSIVGLLGPPTAYPPLHSLLLCWVNLDQPSDFYDHGNCWVIDGRCRIGIDFI